MTEQEMMMKKLEDIKSSYKNGHTSKNQVKIKIFNAMIEVENELTGQNHYCLPVPKFEPNNTGKEIEHDALGFLSALAGL